MNSRKLFVFFVFLASAMMVEAKAEGTYRIYFDADQVLGASSADAIYQGVDAAFAQAGHKLGKRAVEFVRLNHRGNPKRSWLNLTKALADENSLAVIGGVHSPPYITYRDKINASGVVLLLPWSAGAPITRAIGDRNSIFRVSVDDSKAGAFLAEQVLATEACKSVVFLVWNSGWGRSNLPHLEKAFSATGRDVPQHFLFDTGLGESGAQVIVDNVQKLNADCMIIVGNLAEEALLLNELHASGVKIQVFSHWGILLGDFVDRVPAEVRNYLDFQFIQTCALQQEAAGNPVLKDIFETPPIAALEGKSELSDIPSAVGFANAYDLASLLIEAGQALPEEGGIGQHRQQLVQALQGLEQPVDGILKRYVRPFSKYSPDNPDAHEALGREDLCMARFTDDNRVAIAAAKK
ncbi:hypothetical protein FJ695_11175 [Labrenzia sp. PHM005]|nr:hypothetical protein FJ695_11175 [Labrenzia sp. PHM005]